MITESEFEQEAKTLIYLGFVWVSVRVQRPTLREYQYTESCWDFERI